jgi:hypothetical protein
MSDFITFFDLSEQTTKNAQVEIFDPPMCCPTGLCGPALDQTLLDVNEMLLALKAAHVSVERYQMTSHPTIFMKNSEVMHLVRERQMEALPVTLVQGKVIKVGAYPTLAEIQNVLDGKEKS